MKHKKDKFWKDLWSTLVGKLPYIFLGWFFYPFIQRTKVRQKIASGDYNNYTLGLWYMINDDELRHGYGVDYDVKKEGRAKTKLGHFWKSYKFNALRNPAYNWSLTFNPVHNAYTIKETIVDNLTKDGEKVSPLTWARWTWRQKDGSLNNKGETIVLEESIIGEGDVWYDPENGEDVWYCRRSKATKWSYLLWDVYYTFRIGAFGQRYDIVLKNQHALKPAYKPKWDKFKNLFK